jgi:hypothetical protein
MCALTDSSYLDYQLAKAGEDRRTDLIVAGCYPAIKVGNETLLRHGICCILLLEIAFGTSPGGICGVVRHASNRPF